MVDVVVSLIDVFLLMIGGRDDDEEEEEEAVSVCTCKWRGGSLVFS